MIRRPPRSTLFPTRRSSDLGTGIEARSVASRTPRPRHSSQPSPPHASHGENRLSSTGSVRSEEHTSELQSHVNLVCRLLLEKKKKKQKTNQQQQTNKPNTKQ